MPNVVINGGTFTASSPYVGGMWFKGITMTAGTVNGSTGLNPQNSVGSFLTTLASAATANVSAPITNSMTNFPITVADGSAAPDLALSSTVSGGGTTGITKSGPGLLHQTGNWHNFAGTLTVNGGIFNTGDTDLFTPATVRPTEHVLNYHRQRHLDEHRRRGQPDRQRHAPQRRTWTLTTASADWGTYFLGPLSDGTSPRSRRTGRPLP